MSKLGLQELQLPLLPTASAFTTSFDSIGGVSGIASGGGFLVLYFGPSRHVDDWLMGAAYSPMGLASMEAWVV